MSNQKKPTIPEYFSGKNIFLTGGSGFVGKVLIEKLLRSCPKIGDIYLLVRPKRGKTLKERHKEITDAQLFDVVKQDNPRALNKVKCMSGDVTELKLGISEEDGKLLESRVNIIYHVAASVRFDDSFSKAIITNVRSTREIIQLALRCTSLEAFVHVSTAYCNVDNKFIEEKLYPAPVSWRDAIDLAESDMDLSSFTVKYITPWPNTYTFSKRIAEHVTQELCKDKIPAIIIRPSIIVHGEKEPLPGWIDNMNGPFSLIAAGAMGILCSIYAREDGYLDFISVDNVVKGIIIATWERGLRFISFDRLSSKGKSNILIYNACSELLWKAIWFQTYIDDARRAVFFENTIWHFPLSFYQTYYGYYFSNFRHIAISAGIDQLLRLQGKKPRLLRLVRSAFTAQIVLRFFTTNNFVFVTTNFDQLDCKLEEIDKEAFMQTKRPKDDGDVLPYSVNALCGIKRYVFKEKDMLPEETAMRAKRFSTMRHVFNYTIVAIIIYIMLLTWIL